MTGNSQESIFDLRDQALAARDEAVAAALETMQIRDMVIARAKQATAKEHRRAISTLPLREQIKRLMVH